jgi:hypothetical protein
MVFLLLTSVLEFTAIFFSGFKRGAIFSKWTTD